jgi:NADH:ubiquinone reductase (H+-translocating)
MSQNYAEGKSNRYPKHIIILGSGFAGIEVLKMLQKKFRNNKNNIDITLVSKDNFLLFTPMLPEVSSGMIETRHIITSVRTFFKNANFYEASVDSIDLNNKEVAISYAIGNQHQPSYRDHRTLKYDYLVIALGSETNFFGMSNIEENALTMKTIDDAIILRNHIINILEQASINQDKHDLRKDLLTFVVVGGGFSGVETVGSLNDFVKDTVKEFYKNIYMTDIRVILVNAHDKILPEVGEELGDFALQKLKDNGVEFIMNTNVKGATANTAKLDNGTVIPTYTLIWTAGVTPTKVVVNLPCEHDKGHRIVANNYLEVPGYDGVYAVGDCAAIPNPYTRKVYPPTAQNAIEEGRLAAKNIAYAIKGKKNKKKIFNYKNKGIMAQIGRRTGVAQLFGHKFHGFIAWWLWRTFYLSKLPTIKKKLKVMSDWTTDLLFKPDVSMIKRFVVKENCHQHDLESHNIKKENEKASSINTSSEVGV